MSVDHLKLSLGSVTFIINRTYLHLSIHEEASVRRRVNARLGPPCLHAGVAADHLTIPLEPRRHGPLRGYFVPHLTWADRHHADLVAVDLAFVQSVGLAIAEEVLALMHEHVRPVSLQGLANEGYSVLLLRDDAVQGVHRFLDLKRPAFRFKPNRLDALCMDAIDIESLVEADRDRPDFTREQTLFLVREREAELDRLQIKYFTKEVDGRVPGWYTLPPTEVMMTRVDAILASTVGDSFRPVMEVVARELEADLILEPVVHRE